MLFKVLQKPIEYQNCPIVIRQNGECFEYITCINNQIYSSYVEARKSLIQRLFLQDYTKKEITNITNYIIAMAQTTIDSVLGIQPEVKQ